MCVGCLVGWAKREVGRADVVVWVMKSPLSKSAKRAEIELKALGF